jgi:hypothetical protein
VYDTKDRFYFSSKNKKQAERKFQLLDTSLHILLVSTRQREKEKEKEKEESNRAVGILVKDELAAMDTRVRI